MNGQDRIDMFGGAASPEADTREIEHCKIQLLVHLPDVVGLSFVLGIEGVAWAGLQLPLFPAARVLRLKIGRPAGSPDGADAGSGYTAEVVLHIIVRAVVAQRIQAEGQLADRKVPQSMVLDRLVGRVFDRRRFCGLNASWIAGHGSTRKENAPAF